MNYHLGEGCGAGQTGSLRRGRALQGEQTRQARVAAGGGHGVLDGKEDGGAQEDGGFSDTLRNRGEP